MGSCRGDAPSDGSLLSRSLFDPLPLPSGFHPPGHGLLFPLLPILLLLFLSFLIVFHLLILFFLDPHLLLPPSSSVFCSYLFPPSPSLCLLFFCFTFHFSLLFFFLFSLSSFPSVTFPYFLSPFRLFLHFFLFLLVVFFLLLPSFPCLAHCLLSSIPCFLLSSPPRHASQATRRRSYMQRLEHIFPHQVLIWVPLSNIGNPG